MLLTWLRLTWLRLTWLRFAWLRLSWLRLSLCCQAAICMSESSKDTHTLTFILHTHHRCMLNLHLYAEAHPSQ